MRQGHPIIENVKILVVDDDSGVRKLTVNALTYCVNREILSFKDGNAAWHYLKEGGRADIVISDVDMPGMNGIELMTRCKAHRAETIVILMSGITDNQILAERSGADAFLGKPFSLSDLFDIVQYYVVGESAG
ncbi:MAG: response regulator [Desulfobacterales bacterium]|nr:response regulator [Desulfobacterales bacterium]